MDRRMREMPELGIPPKARLFALMAAGGEASNTELGGIRVTKQTREDLNKAGLITSETKTTPHVHSLTGNGWDWCARELAEGEVPDRPGSLGRSLYLVFRGFDRHLQRQGLQPRDVFRPGAPVVSANGLESHIRDAYQKLAREPREFVRLADLRAELREEVDALLKKMSRDRRVYLEPDENRKMLTDADHTAAIRIGGEDNHLIAIEES